MNRYIDIPTIFLVKFPSAKAGLATVGYTLKNADGTQYVARTVANVIDRGNGSYSVALTLTEEMIGSILWDTGEATQLYAEEEFFVEVEHAAASISDPLSTVVPGSDPPVTRGEMIDQLYIPEYSPAPVVPVQAPVNPANQRLSMSVKDLGIAWASSDTVHLTPTSTQIVNGSILSNNPVICDINADGQIVDPVDTLVGAIVDKGASIKVECKRGTNPVYTYYTKTIIISQDDTKDLSTY